MSKLHCANCGRPWTATDGDNGCCWNESICALAIAGRRSPPAPAIDVERVIDALMRVTPYKSSYETGASGLVYRAEVEQVIRACFAKETDPCLKK